MNAKLHLVDAHAVRLSVFSAVNSGKVGVLRCLLKHNFTICVEDFLYAAQKGSLPVVQLLLAHGMDVHAEDDSALWRASSEGHFDVVAHLVDHGARVHANANKALQLASEGGHLKVVKYLIKNGAVFNRFWQNVPMHIRQYCSGF